MEPQELRDSRDQCSHLCAEPWGSCDEQYGLIPPSAGRGGQKGSDNRDADSGTREDKSSDRRQVVASRGADGSPWGTQNCFMAQVVYTESTHSMPNGILGPGDTCRMRLLMALTSAYVEKGQTGPSRTGRGWERSLMGGFVDWPERRCRFLGRWHCLSTQSCNEWKKHGLAQETLKQG